MLVLPIKKKWFDMIKSGEKKEEYREIKPYYDKRLLKYFRSETGIGDVFKTIVFRNGYKHDSPSLKCLCTLGYGKGKEEWRSYSRKRLLHFKHTESRKEWK